MTRSYIYNWHRNAAKKFTITLVAVNASEQGSALRWRHNGRDGVSETRVLWEYCHKNINNDLDNGFW